MKMILSVVLATLLVATGCHQAPKEVETKKIETNAEEADWEITVTKPVFSSTNPELNKQCIPLNEAIGALLGGLEDSLKTDATALFASLEADSISRPLWKYQLFVTDSVFLATERFISVRLTAYTFTGGAHGMTRFYAFNYDVKNQKLLTPEEILNYKQQAAIDKQIQSHFRNPEGCFDKQPTLPLASVINLNDREVCFTYEHYILGAYYCGTAEVNVPLDKLKGSVILK
ncbi:MAG: DUF4163 domain-containing protein [Bacteroidales bacterium]